MKSVVMVNMKDGQPGQKYQFQHRFCSSCSRSKLIEKGYKRKDNRMKHLKGTQFVQLQNKDISLVYTSYCCKTISPYEHLNKWVSKCLESKPHVYFDIALNCCSYQCRHRQIEDRCKQSCSKHYNLADVKFDVSLISETAK